MVKILSLVLLRKWPSYIALNFLLSTSAASLSLDVASFKRPLSIVSAYFLRNGANGPKIFG
jgi:hypothetical protein